MRVVLLLCVICLQMSCISAKKQTSMLSQHGSQLTEALKGNLSSEAKIDVLGNSISSLMSQGLEFKSAIKAGKFVQKYAKTNGPLIESLISSLETEAKGLDPLSQITMGMNLLKKPYVQDIIKMAPEFEKKFKHIAFVGKLMGKVGKPLNMLNGASNGLPGNIQLDKLFGQ
jgi:hypothetical protein